MVMQGEQIVQRQQVEQQLLANRAQLQSLQEQVESLVTQRDDATRQVLAAQAALQGYDMGYAAAQGAQAETPPANDEE